MISAVSRIVGTALALVTIGLATRYLSKTEWGEYSIMLTLGGIFAVLAEWGLYQLLIREISRSGADEQKIVNNLFTLRLSVGLFIFALAPVLSLALPYSNQTRLGILIGMTGYWFLSGVQVLMGLFQKHLRMDKVALAEVAGRVVQLALMGVFIAMHLNFYWIVIATVLSSLANFILIVWYAKKYIKIKLAFDFDFWKKSLSQSFPLAISNVLVMIYFSTDSLFLSIFRPAAEVGIYRLPYKVLESLIFFPSMFVGLVMPVLSSSAYLNWARFKSVFQRSLDVLLIFAVPLIGGTLVLSPKIIYLLGGGRYPESSPILNILIVAVGVIFLGTLFSFALIAIEKQKKLLWISAVGSVFNVAANLIFMSLYSSRAIYVAATTTVLTESLVTVLMLVQLWRALKFLPSFYIFLKTLLAAAVMAVVLWYLSFLNIFILLVLSFPLYFFVLYLLKGFSAAEALELIKKNVPGEDL